jgi:hypothetical protein
MKKEKNSLNCFEFVLKRLPIKIIHPLEKNEKEKTS